MKIAAAEALVGLISDEELCEEYILPKVFDKRVGPAVAATVAQTVDKEAVEYRLERIGMNGPCQVNVIIIST